MQYKNENKLNINDSVRYLVGPFWKKNLGFVAFKKHQKHMIFASLFLINKIDFADSIIF